MTGEEGLSKRHPDSATLPERAPARRRSGKFRS